MTNLDQLNLITETINKAREELSPTSINFIFWGALIAGMSLIHFLFPDFIQSSKYSTLAYWTIIPIFGMIVTVIYNIKVRIKKGYETHLSRALKIIWGVFNIGWIIIVVLSYFTREQSTGFILFLLSIILIISGLLIRFKPLTTGGALVLICSILVILDLGIHPLLLNSIAALSGLFMPGLYLYLNKTDA